MITQVATAVMSNIEEIVFRWLTKRKISFEFQTSLSGGIFELGGAVVDFLLRERGLAWRVMGEYYHRGVEKTGSDIIQKEMLSALGWQVCDLWSDDLLNQLEETMQLALQGREMLR